MNIPRIDVKALNWAVVWVENSSTLFSYNFVIAHRKDGVTTLDRNKWDYSSTTGKHRNAFLGESKKETEAKIKSGVYKLADLNN